MNYHEQVQGECRGYNQAWQMNKHEASMGITNESKGVQTNTRDGTNKGEQVRGECGGYERAQDKHMNEHQGTKEHGEV